MKEKNNQKTAPDLSRILDLILWLPAGKTIFGEVSSSEKTDNQIDTKIAQRFHWKIKTHSKEFVGQYDGHYKTIHNDFLGCRSLRIRFHLAHELCTSDSINELTIFSNGLYRWRLYLNSAIEDSDIEQAKEKLARHFLISHIIPLFGDKWTKIVPTKIDSNVDDYIYNTEIQNYNGVLNFQQCELLFEGPFNICLSPSIFLPSIRRKEDFEKLSSEFQIDSILKQLVMYSNEKGYRLVTDGNVQYNWIVKKDEEQKGYPQNDDENTAFHQVLVAAEQFLRVVISIGVLRILEGVQDVQRELLEREVSTATSRSAEQLRRISKDKEIEKTSNIMFESYFKLLETKFPIISWLLDLINDLISSSDLNALLERVSGSDPGDSDNHSYKMDRAAKTYLAAYGQFKRVILLIKNNIEAIQSMILLRQEDSKVHLLSEIRRVNEFMFEHQGEQDISISELKIQDEERNLLMTGIGVMTLIISIIIGTVQVATWVFGNITKMLDEKSFLPWNSLFSGGALIILFVLILFVFKKPQTLYKWLKTYFEKFYRSELSKHVQDRESKIDGNKKKDINLNRLIIDLKTNKALNFSTFNDQFKNFWKEYDTLIEKQRQVFPPSRNIKWHSETFVERPNKDIVRYKYVLKKNDDGNEPVKSRFTIRFEISQHIKIKSVRLSTINLTVTGKDTLKTDAEFLIKKLITQKVFPLQADYNDLDSELTSILEGNTLT